MKAASPPGMQLLPLALALLTIASEAFSWQLASHSLPEPVMDQKFDAAKFVEQFDHGLLDGRLDEELAKLTQEQLTEVALLLARLVKA